MFSLQRFNLWKRHTAHRSEVREKWRIWISSLLRWLDPHSSRWHRLQRQIWTGKYECSCQYEPAETSLTVCVCVCVCVCVAQPQYEWAAWLSASSPVFYLCRRGVVTASASVSGRVCSPLRRRREKREERRERRERREGRGGREGRGEEGEKRREEREEGGEREEREERGGERRTRRRRWGMETRQGGGGGGDREREREWEGGRRENLAFTVRSQRYIMGGQTILLHAVFFLRTTTWPNNTRTYCTNPRQHARPWLLWPWLHGWIEAKKKSVTPRGSCSWYNGNMFTFHKLQQFPGELI